MRTYSVPPDTRDKEKLFGGIFTISQFIFLILGVIIGLGIGIILYQIIPSIIVLVLGLIIGFAIGVPFAFFKKRSMGDMELAKYLWLRFLYKKKPKKLIHVNENYQRQAQQNKVGGKE